MLKQNPAEGFFKQAREKGSKNKNIINGKEVKKELQPGIKYRYRRA
jgi:hypothetical protein